MILKRALHVLALVMCLQLKAQIVVKASVDHIVPWTSDNQGNFYLNVSGGTTPYNFTWTPGNSNIQDLPNVSAGNYTLVVKDSGRPPGTTNTYYYSLGYKTVWKNFFGTKQVNDSLKTTSEPNFSNRTALTKNTLPASTNGWCEYVVGPYTNPYLFGFADSTSVVSLGDQYDIDFGFHRNGSNIYAWSAGAFTSIGTSINEGDVVRLERTGSTFYLKINNVTKFTASANNKKQKIKALITTSGQLVNMGVSFNDSTAIDKMQFVVANPDHIKTDALDSLGNLLIKEVRGGQPPYTYTWTPGALYARDLPDSKKNTYSVKIRDNNGDTIRRYYDIGYKAVWKNFYGTVASNDSLKSNLASGYTDRTATSVNELRPNTNGWISYIVPRYDRPMIMGFLDSVIVANQNSGNDIDFGLHLTNNNLMYAFYNLSYIYLGQAYIGDVIRLERNGSTFYLKRNNTTLYSNTAPANKKMMIKGLVNASTGVSTQLVDIGASFADSTNTTALGAKAIIDHLKTDGVDVIGGVKLKVYGGVSPYTYTWTPNNLNTRDNLSLPKGICTVKIKDFNNTQVTYTYNIGYKSRYMNNYQSTLRNDTLLPNNTAFYDKPAVTTSELKGGADGWVEYVLPKFVGPWVIGFLDTAYVANQTNSWDVDFAMHENNGYYYCMIGYNFYNLGTVREGDVLRLEKTGSTFYLKKNGVTQYTATANASSRYRVKASPVTSSLPCIGYSFKFDVLADKEHIDVTNSFSGQASLVPSGGVAYYRARWDDNSTSLSRVNLTQGTYTTYVVDSMKVDTVKKTFNIGLKPTWGLQKNIVTANDSLKVKRTDSLGIAVSDIVVGKNKSTWFEGKVNNLNNDFTFGFIGLSDTNSYPPVFGSSDMQTKINLAYGLMRDAVNRTLPYVGTDSVLNLSTDYDNVNFIRIKNGKIKLLFKGAAYATNYSYSAGDVISVGRNSGGYMYFSINDQVVYTHNRQVGGQFFYGTTIININPVAVPKKGVLANDAVIFILNSNTYGVLRRKLDGGYHQVNGGKLYFTVDGEYNESAKLNFSIYKEDTRGIVLTQNSAGVTGVPVVNGDNRYLLNLATINSGEFNTGNINKYYVMEVTNEKKEKFYLKFRYGQ